MTLIHPIRPVILLYECQSDTVSLWNRTRDDYEDFGKWLIREMKAVTDYCIDQDVKPDFHVSSIALPQEAIDKIEVEEFLQHAEFGRSKD